MNEICFSILCRCCIYVFRSFVKQSLWWCSFSLLTHASLRCVYWTTVALPIIIISLALPKIYFSHFTLALLLFIFCLLHMHWRMMQVAHHIFSSLERLFGILYRYCQIWSSSSHLRTWTDEWVEMDVHVSKNTLKIYLWMS